MDLQINQQVLENFGGKNFFNIGDNTQKKEFIQVTLETIQDLEDKRETLNVRSSLPFSHYYGTDLESFIKELKEFVKLPLAKIRTSKKSPLSYYELSSIGVRDTTIRLRDIDFQIGELAEKKMNELGITDFKAFVGELLEQQKEVNISCQSDIDNLITLREKIYTLKCLLGKRVNTNSYYNSDYRTPKDETMKIVLSPEQYNQKLEEIEKELRVIEKRLGLRETTFEYIKEEKKEEISFEEWFNENEEQLREDYESNDEGEMTFEEYAELVFNEGD